MTEIVRRPRRPNTFLQVSVAVFSGMAALYCIQKFPAQPAVKPAARLRPAVKPAPRPKPASEHATRPGDLPRPVVDHRKLPLAPNSMMVKPEPGSAPQAVFDGGGELSLESKGWISNFGTRGVNSDGIGQQFKSAKFQSMASRKPIPRQLPVVGAGLPQPQLIEKKAIPEAEVIRPSPFDPTIPVEKPTWTRERAEKVAVSGLIALFGAVYLVYCSGVFSSSKEQHQDRA